MPTAKRQSVSRTARSVAPDLVSPGITRPRGFRAAGGTCGIKPSGAPDLTLIVADGLCTAAGVFTRNRLPGAPVVVSKAHLRSSAGTARAIVCNSGVSNVSTGEQGMADARTMCRTLADELGCAPREVLVCSTGVIGKPLPMGKIVPGIRLLAGQLQQGPDADALAARCILTTDLVPKTAGCTLVVGGKRVTIAGIAKGSGMIAPNMATMLAFITTDAAITPAALRQALRHAVDRSFNRISVDEDTSTSDSVLVLASGAAGHRRITGRNAAFTDALTRVCESLAYQVVKDGEGATKVFRVVVKGARSAADADRVGRTIVGSPLVKTAVHGGDPNWGRLVMAVGRSGAACRFATLTIGVGDVTVYRRGAPLTLDAAGQARLKATMAAKEITFTIDLGMSRSSAGEATWLGCDLSREYIAINADYTT
jgi:glutamate N-acetyltransferase/amino-acid N-acetyltransferase